MDVQSVPSSSLSVAPSSLAAQSGGRGDLMGQSSTQTGAGQDFVLFDDAGNSSGLAPASNLGNQAGASTQMYNPNRPPHNADSSFTEHRGHQSGIQPESPFSSPASRPEDDFGIGDAYSIESGSGTLAYGTPKSKRQRGHGYSSSWTGGNLQQHRQHQQAKYPSGGTLASAMAPTNSYGGSKSSRLSDYSGSDTSPQNPPSGTFGPPIHSLSLGEGSDVSFPTLFPSAIPLTSVSSNSGSSTLDGALPPSSLTPIKQQQQQQPNHISLQAQQQGQSQRQQLDERARQQIRAELMGVDSRALKGPLRDIQQGMGQDDNQQAVMSNLTFNSYQPNNLYPDHLASNNTSSRPGGLIRQRSGSLDESFLTSNQSNNPLSAGLSWSGLPTNDFNAFDLQGLDGYRPQFTFNQQTPQFDLQDMYNTPSSSQSSTTKNNATSMNRPGLSGPKLSARTQQAVDRARAQKPTRKRMTRDGSGLTVSPQDAFLDYNNIESLLQSSQPPHMPSNDRSLFDAPSGGLSSMLSSDSSSILTPKATSSFQDISSGPAPFGPSSVLSTTTHEGTPSLVDASSSSSSNGSRATSMVSSPLQRLPLNREDTVRPPKKKMTDSASQQSIFSNDLFSPAYSTSSSTDDEDEKPYKPNSQSRPLQSLQQGPSSHHEQQQHQQQQRKWQFPFPSQASKDQMASLPHGLHSGPRFSAVSSSSSESEDDDQRGRQSNTTPYNGQGRRTMGGYGYMGSSQESGMSINPPYFPSSSQADTKASMQIPIPPSSQEASEMYPPGSSQHATTRAQQNDNSTPQSAGVQSDSQSQDERLSLSPSIRTSAQAILPSNSNQYQQNTSMSTSGQRSQSRNRAQQAALSAASTAAANANRAASEASHSSMESNSEWETGEESEADGSDYRDERRKAGAGGGATTKKSSGTRKRRRDVTAGGRSNRSGAGQTTATASHLTVCDYVSPLNGEACRTEFHRPYDLARHRETIHAREEAQQVKQGRLRKDQCVVLYREVDPAKSLATVEWKCEGKNGCGSLFSRKDALLRHKRIRGH